MRTLSPKGLLIGFGVAILLGGCSAAQPNLAKGTDVPVRAIQRGAAKVVNTSAVHLDESLFIKGQVEKPFPSRVRGHLDVAVYGNDGALIGKESVKYRNISQRRGKSSVPFNAELSALADVASVVYVAYHGIPLRHGDLTDCDENVAIPGS